MIQIAPLALLWVLMFTAPTMNSGQARSCPVGCRDTTQSTPTLDSAAFEVWRHRQSPTWVARAAAFRAEYDAGSRVLSDSLARHWSTIRTEADWALVISRATSAAERGMTCTIVLPDTMAGGWYYAVVTRDTAGNRSCVSNEVWR